MHAMDSKCEHWVRCICVQGEVCVGSGIDKGSRAVRYASALEPISMHARHGLRVLK